MPAKILSRIKVLYEDANILAIDKPSGILVHPAAEQARNGVGSDKQKTILDIFECLNGKKIPVASANCDYCNYIEAVAKHT